MPPDLRFAVRSLAKSPGFALVAILSLALGIGANTAIFSLVDAVMLRALPVPDPDELVRVTFGGPGDAQFTNPLWEEMRDRGQVLDGAFAYSSQQFDLASGGEARPVEGQWVSGGFFATLGVAPALGRLLNPGDDVRGCAPVAVLSHGFWQNEMGGDRSAVGRTLPLNGHAFEIVGVAPAGFTGFEVGHAPQLYVPLCAKAILDPPLGNLDNRSMWFLRVGGRLPEGMSLAEARSRMEAIAPALYTATVPAEWNDEMRRGYLDNGLGLEEATTGYSDLRLGYERAILAMMLVVGIVLLIACANVANLLLARATRRQREIAIRQAIGAGRRRLLRQLLTESLLLSTLGAAAGLLVAVWVNGVILGFLSAASDAVWLDLDLNGRVLAFTALVAVGTAVLFGLVPAWRATRVAPHLAMKGTDANLSSGRPGFSAGRMLVAGQIALSLVLLVAAGLLIGTFRHLAHLDPGFEPRGVLLASVDLRNAGYADETLPTVKQEMLERVREIPQVRSAAASAIIPLSGAGWNGPIGVKDYTPSSERDGLVFYNAVSEGFFATLGTELVAGREFGPADRAGAPIVAVVNESLARKFFSGRNPIGESVGIGLGGPQVSASATIVGVVRDTKYMRLREDTQQLIYIPLQQEGWGGAGLNLELRTAGDPAALIPLVARALTESSPRASIRFETMTGQMSAALTPERLLAMLTGAFGALALLLAVVGLYGTIAYSVARRRGELGVRMALGAERRDLVGMVLREAGRTVAIGVLIGGAIALAATRLVASFLYGISPTDPAVLAAAVLTLALVALAAGALPAWRASRVDPMTVLRGE